LSGVRLRGAELFSAAPERIRFTPLSAVEEMVRKAVEALDIDGIARRAVEVAAGRARGRV
jgi:hypothetical protein